VFCTDVSGVESMLRDDSADDSAVDSADDVSSRGRELSVNAAHNRALRASLRR